MNTPLRGREKVAAENRRARFEYAIGDVYEAGIELVGTEVKSLRMGKASLAEAFASADDGEIWLHNLHIPEYTHAGTFYQHEPRRKRRLLLHRREIAKLTQAVTREGMTLVPLKIYFNDRGRAKVALALAKGKKLHDKRAADQKRSWERDRARLLRNRG